jgi:hypothetical protein
MKKKGGVRTMEYLFVLLLLVGAIGIQIGNGWLSKNEFSITSFLMMVPLLLVAQYFIAWGYHDGTQQSTFITAHIVWTGILICATLAVNYALFQTVPGLWGMFALALSGIAAIIAVLGK